MKISNLVEINKAGKIYGLSMQLKQMRNVIKDF